MNDTTCPACGYDLIDLVKEAHSHGGMSGDIDCPDCGAKLTWSEDESYDQETGIEDWYFLVLDRKTQTR